MADLRSELFGRDTPFYRCYKQLEVAGAGPHEIGAAMSALLSQDEVLGAKLHEAGRRELERIKAREAQRATEIAALKERIADLERRLKRLEDEGL